MPQPQPEQILKRSIFKRILGRCATQPPSDAGCWQLKGGLLSVDLTRTPELSQPGGGVRLEGGDLLRRVLVIHGDDGAYHAFHNRCTHAGRRLDPVPGALTVQCCSVGKSTYSYTGEVLRGNVKDPIKTYPVTKDGDTLVIDIQQ